VLAATQWHILAHTGFIRSFLSAVRFAPISGQQAAWKRLILQKRNILIITATHDPVIVPEELKPDVEELLLDSGSTIDWHVIDGAHDIPSTHPEKIVENICAFWGM
jgi:predicted esterase